MDWHAKKVLIVEDSRVINMLLVHNISSQLHIDVVSAYSMAEAEEILHESPDDFFIAILDLNLPDAPNGEIVDFVIELGIYPIIFTGNMSDNLHKEMLEKPIVDYVIKRNLNEVDYVIQTVKRIRENVNRKVLVVDDSKSSRTLLCSLLRRHNLTVLEADGALSALSVLTKNENITLMIADFNMPEMNGIDLTSKVREKYSRTELAIIGISASGSGNTSIRFLKAGANDFIARPFMHEEFYCRINQNIDAIDSYQMLEKTADLDFLTGLYNRAYLFKTGQKLIQNAVRKNITLCTAMIDIDFFKLINDNYGHHVGDEVLKHISRVFTHQMRESDIITRIGGEEFCLLCVNLSEYDAPSLFQRFLLAVSEIPIVIDSLKIKVTISIGYTTTLSSSLDDMLKCADQALYAAKKNGRNQVQCFEDIIENKVEEIET